MADLDRIKEDKIISKANEFIPISDLESMNKQDAIVEVYDKSIKSIVIDNVEVVSEYPEVEVPGVLYLKQGNSPTPGEFQRKPVVIWESNTPSEYLKGIQANISADPAWQLTNLDMTPFKRIKIYSCAGQKSGTAASTTPAIILEMSLDNRAAISAYSGNYVASTMVQKPNDVNRLAILTCAVSADKTKFVVLRQTDLYGTAATGNDDVNANVFLIEGYYD